MEPFAWCVDVGKPVGADNGGFLVYGVGTDRGVGVGYDDEDGIAGASSEEQRR